MGILTRKDSILNILEQVIGKPEDYILSFKKDDPIIKYMKMFQDILFEQDYEHKPYLNTTENQSYMKQILPKKVESAFTILSGGDHCFNLLSQDVLDIVCADTNELQKFVFALKCASFRTLANTEYEDFLMIREGDRFFSKDIFHEVKEGFKKEEELERRLWEYIINYTPRDEIQEFVFKGGLESLDITLVRESLPFIKKKGLYAKVRDNLEKSTITIYDKPATTAILESKKVFDYIDMMSILYFSVQLNSKQNYEKEIEDFKKIYEEHLNPEGIMVLNYMFSTSIKDLENPNEYVRERYQKNYQDLKKYFDVIEYQVRGVPKAVPIEKPGMTDSVVYVKKARTFNQS